MKALNVLYDKYSGDDEFLEDDKLFSIIEKELKDNERLVWIIKHRKPNFVLIAQTSNVVEYNMKATVQLGGNEYMLCKAVQKYDLLKEKQND